MEYGPVIVLLIAWLLLALIAELGIEAAVARILRIIVIVVALVIIVWGGVPSIHG